MCSLDRENDVCDCMINAVQIATEGKHVVDLATLRDAIHQTAQVARKSGQDEERYKILKELESVERPIFTKRSIRKILAR